MDAKANTDKPDTSDSPERKPKMTQIVFNINTQINVNCLHKKSESSELNIYNSMTPAKADASPRQKMGLYFG